MVKVLHVLGTTNLGGAESRIMDLFRHMDREQVMFDFLVHMDPEKYEKAIADGVNPEEYRESGHFDEEIESLGGHVYALPRFVGTNYAAYKKAACRFFEMHHDYSVVQGHMTSTASIYLPIAKRVGIEAKTPRVNGRNMPITVAHTRNAGVDAGIKGIVTKTLRSTLHRKADFLFACSHLAGDATFRGHEYTYIPNTIDTSRFLFDISSREEIRKQYGIPDNAIVLGNVARFTPQKNQRYLIDTLGEMKKKGNLSINGCEIYVMLCGDGELRNDCENQAKELGVADRIIFAGNQKEVEKYYSAMDLYVFPSIYEGLPGVVVEAQASGLICLISDTITTEVLLTDTSENMSIGISASLWADKISEIISKHPELTETDSTDKMAQIRKKAALQVRKAGFDVNDQARKMAEFYISPCEETLPCSES